MTLILIMILVFIALLFVTGGGHEDVSIDTHRRDGNFRVLYNDGNLSLNRSCFKPPDSTPNISEVE